MLDADDSVSALKAYLDGEGLTHLKGYGRGGAAQVWDDSVASGGFNYAPGGIQGYPNNICFDRDGNARFYAVGAIDGNPDPIEALLKQLLGVP